MEPISYRHVPVLLRETIENIITDKSGIYLDATLGLGGHAEAILNALSPDGRVLGIDVDPEAMEMARKRLHPFGNRFKCTLGNFKDVGAIIEKENHYPLSGALFDLGVSSLQLDRPERGFSFMRTGPLDMRLGPDAGMTAEMIVNRWPAEQIAMLINEFGEDPSAERIARAIVARRQKQPFTTTTELAECIAQVVPRTGNHPATQAFQALRMAVNSELEALSRGLASVMPYVKPGGRLLVISFHSLEDRIVKNMFASLISQGICVYPGAHAQSHFSPSKREQENNPRCRSAKLRVIEKLVPEDKRP